MRHLLHEQQHRTVRRPRSRSSPFATVSVFFPRGVGILGFGLSAPRCTRRNPSSLFPAGSVIRRAVKTLTPQGRYSGWAREVTIARLLSRLHLCFGSFTFGTVSLVSVVACTHPGTFCPGPILFYSLQSCARGRYSSLPRFWAGRTILVSGLAAFTAPPQGKISE
jgi:hypothetical protein